MRTGEQVMCYVSPALLRGHLLALLSWHLLTLLLGLLIAHLPVHLLTGPLGHLLALSARHLSAHIAGYGLANLPGPRAARGLGHFSATSGDLQLLSSSGPDLKTFVLFCFILELRVESFSLLSFSCVLEK